MINTDIYYREKEDRIIAAVFKDEELIAIASASRNSEKEFTWKQSITFYGAETETHEHLVAGDSWTNVLRHMLDEVMKLANAQPKQDTGTLKEQITDIYELAQTDLPIIGFTTDAWNTHRIRRIEVMASNALKMLETPEKEGNDEQETLLRM